MKLQVIDEHQKTIVLPRVNHEFIGLGHELQQQRKQRRQIQQEHQAIQNRVLLLSKQQIKARKNLLKKKNHLQQLINIQKRQQKQSDQKNKHQQQKMQELERLKRQNQIIRMIHKNNYQSSVAQLKDRNHSDYSRIRLSRINGQYTKRAQKNKDMQQKRDNWLSLNIQKQKGKQRVDQFYKDKNKQHVKQYQSRILMQHIQKQSRVKSIKNLQQIEQELKLKLEHSTMRNSKMQELIKGVSRTLSPMNISSMQTELFRTSRVKKSYETLNETQKQKQKSITRTNSRQQSAFYRSSSNKHENQHQQVQQNIQLQHQEYGKSQFKLIRKRKKNKHINRYKEYQAY